MRIHPAFLNLLCVDRQTDIYGKDDRGVFLQVFFAMVPRKKMGEGEMKDCELVSV
jgi:hypothetical protein